MLLNLRFHYFHVTIFLNHLLPPSRTSALKMWQQVPLKLWYLLTKAHDVTSHKTAIVIITILRSSNHTRVVILYYVSHRKLGKR
jgi:hypothetical protein